MSRNGQRQGYVVQHSLPQEKAPSAAQLKLLFGDSCSVFNNKRTRTCNAWRTDSSRSNTANKVAKKSLQGFPDGSTGSVRMIRQLTRRKSECLIQEFVELIV